MIDIEKLIDILQCYNISCGDVDVLDDDSIDVNSSVSLYNYSLSELPLKFNMIYGDFNCSNNKLTTLDKFPKYIQGNLNCSFNSISSLSGMPLVEGSIDFSNNNITSLRGCPEIVKGYLDISSNNLRSLKGCSKVIEGNFLCSYNKKLKNLKYLPEQMKDLKCDELLHNTIEYKRWNVRKKLKELRD